MVVLGANTVLLGGSGYPVPDDAMFVPTADGGGNVAVWSGTMADIGVPVQDGIPIADLDRGGCVVVWNLRRTSIVALGLVARISTPVRA
jgi:hypothetical protein